MVVCAGLPSTLTNIQDLPVIRPSLSRFIQWGESGSGNFWPTGSGLFWKRVPNPDLDPNGFISDPHHCTGAKRPKVEILIEPRPLSNQKYLILAPPGTSVTPCWKKNIFHTWFKIFIVDVVLQRAVHHCGGGRPTDFMVNQNTEWPRSFSN